MPGTIAPPEKNVPSNDELLSLLGHELRAPLASLMGFADLLLEQDYPAEKQREFLRIIHDESRRLADLIDHLLDLQRIQSGRIAWTMERVDVASLLREALDLLATSRTTHAFVAEIAEDLPPILADVGRLRQVIRNLLSNAVQYSPGGGAIRVGAAAQPAGLRFWVADEGIGIPPEEMPNIFERFFRGSNAARAGVRGTGLGLTLCREIVRAAGGEIRVQSTLGHGTTFEVSLPVAP